MRQGFSSEGLDCRVYVTATEPVAATEPAAVVVSVIAVEPAARVSAIHVVDVFKAVTPSNGGAVASVSELVPILAVTGEALELQSQSGGEAVGSVT